MGEKLPSVGMTAVWAAMLRASEGMRSDPLFNDRLASAFVAAARLPAEIAALDPDTQMPGAREYVVTRTRFLDDYLLRSCTAGVRQIALLAAGFDTRAFRLGWPAGVRLFELELPELSGFKEAVLAERGAWPRCRRVVVAADLRGGWAAPLTAAGFDPTIPVAWLAEGLFPYLTVAESDRLLAAVSELSIPGSHLAFDHAASSAMQNATMRKAVETARTMDIEFRLIEDDPVEWMAKHGWDSAIIRAPELCRRYGRPLPEPDEQSALRATMVCTATR